MRNLVCNFGHNFVWWVVLPPVIFILLRILIEFWNWVLKIFSYCAVRWQAKQKPQITSWIVCAFPPFFPGELRRGVFRETDMSFMFSRQYLKRFLLVCEEIKNEEQSEWVAPAFKRQMQNYLALHHKPWLSRFFHWLGFTGAYQAGLGQFAISVLRRNYNGKEIHIETAVVCPKRVIGASLSERLPTPMHKKGLSFDERLKLAREELAIKKEDIQKRCKKPLNYNHPLLLQEEARIAGNWADSEGEVIRFLEVLGSADRTINEFTEQTIIGISRIY